MGTHLGHDRTRPRPRSLPLALSTTLVLLAAACAGERPAHAGGEDTARAGAPDPAAPAGAMPAIYVDSQVEFFGGGNNTERDSYLRTVEACRKGGMAPGELSDEDVARLGTGRLQRWYLPDAFAYRWERWGYYAVGGSPSGLCQFRLSTQGAHHFITGDAHSAIDLKTGKAFSDPDSYRFFFPREPVDTADGIAALTVEARGESRVPDRDRQVAGQPCEHFVRGYVDACDWSGGKQWGFDTKPHGLAVDNVRSLATRITLEQEPVDGNGMRVTTPVFQLGAVFDESDMHPREAE